MADRTDVKISVIVPVYNVEKELPRCIESLLTQTYPNFELAPDKRWLIGWQP